MRSRRKHRRRQRLHLKRPASGQNPQPAQIVWLALRSSSLRLAPARRSSPMAGNRAVAGRVGTIRDRAPVVAALIATGRAGRSGSLWDALGRAVAWSLPLALHGPPETRSCASGCDPCPARIGVKTQFLGRATWTGIAQTSFCAFNRIWRDQIGAQDAAAGVLGQKRVIISLPFFQARLRPLRCRSAQKLGSAGGHKRQKTPKKFKKTRSVFLVLSVL